MVMTRNHPVMRRDPRTGAARVFKNAKEAADKMGLDRVTLNHACVQSHGMKRYRGYEWSYIPSDAKRRSPGPFAGHRHTTNSRRKMSRAKDAKKKRIAALTDEGFLVDIFESVAEAVREGFNRACLHKALKGRFKQYRGFRWIYL